MLRSMFHLVFTISLTFVSYYSHLVGSAFLVFYLHFALLDVLFSVTLQLLRTLAKIFVHLSFGLPHLLKVSFLRDL